MHCFRAGRAREKRKSISCACVYNCVHTVRTFPENGTLKRLASPTPPLPWYSKNSLSMLCPLHHSFVLKYNCYDENTALFALYLVFSRTETGLFFTPIDHFMPQAHISIFVYPVRAQHGAGIFNFYTDPNQRQQPWRSKIQNYFCGKLFNDIYSRL